MIIELVEEALLNGFDVDAIDKNGNTLLLTAAQNGLKRMSKMLLCYGANINVQNKKRAKRLHYCFKYGFLDLFQYFVRKGAKETLRNCTGKTCYEK